MDRPVGEVQEPRPAGVSVPELADHVEGPVGQVVREVVALRVVVDVQGPVVLVEAVRLVEVGEAVQDPVEAVEALLARPAVPGAGLGELRVRAEVPLADHERRPAGIPEDLAHRDGVVADGRCVAGEARLHVAHGAHAGQVVVQPREQGGPRGRTHRVDVEVGVAQALGGQPVDVRGVHLGAVAPDVAVPQVVHQHDQHVGRTVRSRGRLGPVRRRRGHDPTDVAAEARVRLSRVGLRVAAGHGAPTRCFRYAGPTVRPLPKLSRARVTGEDPDR